MRIKKRFAYALMAIASALVFSLGSCAQSINAQSEASAEEGFFASIEAELVEETGIPVYLPKEVARSFREQEVYPEAIEAVQSAYSVAYGRVPDCNNATFCRVGWIEGYQVGTPGYSQMSVEEMVSFAEENLPRATRRSEDEIEQVTLVDGTEAVVLPWIGYAHPGPTEVIFEKHGYRYVFSMVMAPNEDVIEMANDALAAGAIE